MPRTSTNIEALLVKYIFQKGKVKGEYVEITVESLAELAEELKVNYAALTRRVNESKLIEKEPIKLRIKKN